MTIHMAMMGQALISIKLSGESGITGFELSPGTSDAGVRVNSGGTVQKRQDGVFTQIDANTDWIIPNSAASGSYSIRCTNNGDALDAGSAATGTWLALSSSRQWYVSQSSVGPAKTLNIDLEISADGGTTVLTSATYSGSATVEV